MHIMPLTSVLCSTMDWSSAEFILFGAESGMLCVWDANTLVSTAAANGHDGETHSQSVPRAQA